MAQQRQMPAWATQTVEAWDDMSEAPGERNCGEALRELYTYLDGELTTDRRAHIESHLNGCNPCLEAYDFQAELRMVIAQRCRDEVPPALLEKIADLISGPPSSADA